MTETEEKRAVSPLAIIGAAGAAGLLLVLLFFHSSPATDVSPEQAQLGTNMVGNMMTNGVLADYDCSKSLGIANRAVWDTYNVEQKRNMTVALATVCQVQHHAGYTVTIVDTDTRAQLASFDGKTVTLAPK